MESHGSVSQALGGRCLRGLLTTGDQRRGPRGRNHPGLPRVGIITPPGTISQKENQTNTCIPLRMLLTADNKNLVAFL